MRFLKSRLGTVEKVLVVGRVSKIIYAPGLISFILFLLSLQLNPAVALGFFIFGAYYLIRFSSIPLHNEYVVTDSRVLAKHGSKNSSILELPHDKVIKVAVEQGVLGQIFDYGNILVYGRNEADRIRVEYICSPSEVRNKTVLIMDKIYDT